MNAVDRLLSEAPSLEIDDPGTLARVAGILRAQKANPSAETEGLKHVSSTTEEAA